MKENLIIKFNIFILSFLFLFSSTGFSLAQAGTPPTPSGPEIPSVEDILDDVEQRYGYDPNILRRTRHKESAPEVEIFFDNTSPEEGEDVTATALPKGFKNSNENLYYTWFILHKGDEDMEKAKREAMGIVARGDFDPELFGIDYKNDGGDDDGFFAPVGGKDGVGAKEVEGEESKTDILNTSIGEYENDNFLDPPSKEVVDSEKITRCYRHNFGGMSYDFSASSSMSPTNPNSAISLTDGFSGKDMVISCSHKFPSAEKNKTVKIEYENGDEKTFTCEHNYTVGDGRFTKKEELCWKLNPKNPDTDGDGINDEADVAGLAQTQFTWSYRDGDRVGVIIEGTSIIPINEDNTTGEEPESGSVSFDGTGTGEGSTDSNDDSTGSGDLDGSVDAEGITRGYEGGMDTTSGVTSYYKIMWAGLGVCDAKEEDDGIEEDECDSEEDYGFTFLKFKDVYEKAGDLLEADLFKIPEKPQFDVLEEEYSDQITITAEIKNKNINKNFVYFDWELYKCEEGEVEECTYIDADDWSDLTRGTEKDKGGGHCGTAETLGECAKYKHEEAVESNSYAEGIGRDKITFRPLGILIKREKEYLKVILKTKKRKSSVEYSLADIVFPIVRNDAKIKFFKLNKGAGGRLSFSEREDEICTKGIYKDVCPVYPFQVVAVKSEFLETDEDEIEGYIWQVNRASLNPPLKCSEYFGKFEDKKGIVHDICNREDLAIFPILGKDLFLSSITANIKRKNSNDLISERIYSVNQPLAKIRSTDLKTAWPFVRHDGSDSDDVFQAEPENDVSFKANIIPDYLDLEDVKLTWFYNGDKVDKKFIEKNEELEIELNKNVISLKLPKNISNSISITARIEKVFYADDVRLLGEGWNILNTANLSKDSTITIKKWIPSEAKKDEESASLKLFLASTIKNIPEHLLFVMRLAIVLILILTIIFGFSYFLEYKEKDKKI